MRKEKSLVTPSILKWARETIGYSEEWAAEKIKAKKVTFHTVKQWELGSAQPTYPQLKKLAELYKRPVAIFFFPKPPQEDPIKEDFRSTLPSDDAEKISPPLRYLVRQAKARQIDLDELQGETASRGTIKDLRAEKQECPEAMAECIRDRLGISVNEQVGWDNPENALKKWRAALEAFGIWIFKDAFRDDDYSGFCIYDEKFPVIYINNSHSKQRQIFTLFHELGHLLSGHAGVAFRSEPKFGGKHQEEEVFCNAFSAAFLVPKDVINQWAPLPDDETIDKLAKKYKVSFDVILRRFLDKRLISKEDYYGRVRERQRRYDKSKKGKPSVGGDYYLTQKAYLGEKYIELAFKQYYRQRIDQHQLADYLGIKLSSVKSFEDVFLKF